MKKISCSRAWFGGLVLLGLACSRVASSPDGANAESAWTTRLQHALAAQEYEITEQLAPSCAPEGSDEPLLQAPNRAHDLRTCFTAGGVHLASRSPDRRWRVGLSLLDHPRAEPRVDGNRVEYRRGALTEWYVNDTDGLEQGFTLAGPLSDGPETLLRLSVSGDLKPVAGGDTIELHSDAGVRVLDYAKLVAWDANRRALPAELAVVGDTIEIRATTAGATFPVTIDPLITQPALWGVSGSMADGFFAYAVATAGDVDADGYSDVIVGTPYYDDGQVDEGRVSVFRGGPDGPGLAPAWNYESDIDFASLGFSVGTAGDVNGDGYSDVIVGAPDAGSGRALVFHGGPAGLNPTPAWNVIGVASFDSFGYSVGVAGDVNGDGYSDVIVGATGFESPLAQISEGAAYVFHGSATGLATTAAWSAQGNQAGAAFGYSVATAGDFNGDGYSDVIIGAYRHDTQANDNEGRAFVYPGGVAGLSPSPILNTGGGEDTAEFGSAVATAGDFNGDGFSDVLIGAPLADSTGPDAGRVFLLPGGPIGPGNTITLNPPVLAGTTPVRFGAAVGTAGDIDGDRHADVLVGCPPGVRAGIAGGFALLYSGYQLRSAGSSSGPTLIPPPVNQTGARFGAALGTAGDVDGDGYSDVIVGSPNFTPDAQHSNAGRAFVFAGRPDALLPEAWRVIRGAQSSSHFAYSVASAGDVNGDGNSDVVVGARFHDNGLDLPRGRVQVHHGNADGLGQTPDWSLAPAPEPTGDLTPDFGFSVAGAGDVNDDGYGDVLVGALGYGGGGAAFLYLGGPAPPTTAAWSAASSQSDAEFAVSVAGAGDVNGDGHADVIVGAPFESHGHTEEGRAYVFHGRPQGLSASATTVLELNIPNAHFGGSVASAGDVNADGYSDVVVGATGYPAAAGAAFVFLGGPEGLSTIAIATLRGSPGVLSGRSVAGAGDTNGDGYGDVLVGASGISTAIGYVYAYLGGPAGISGSAAQTLEGTSSFGTSLAGAGDVDDDGYGDVLIGSPNESPVGKPQRGGAYLSRGGPAGPSTSYSPVGSDASLAAGDHFGSSVASGDINGDGAPDVLVGSPFSDLDLDTPDVGSFHVHLGSGPPEPQLVNPRQRRPDGTPLAPLGTSGTLDGVSLGMRGSSPFGRSDVSMQFELKPFGVPFDGTALQRSTYADSGLFGSPLSVVLSGLPRGAYHWRMRTKYHPSTTPFQPHGPWRMLAANPIHELDFRTEQDADGDGAFDRLDTCPFFPSPTQADADQDGRGNVCECTDQNGDGRNTVADIVAINQAIFNPALVTPLCDGNNDQLCSVADIVAANLEIFSPTSTSRCSHQPFPGP
jgi:hypothetical protein